MNGFRYAAAALILVVAADAVRAGDDVLVPADPPLTRALADRKIDFWQAVFGRQLDERQRAELRQLEVGEWRRNDKGWRERWVQLLDVWQEATREANAEQLRAGIRRSALESLARSEADAVGGWLLARTPAPAAPVPPGATPGLSPADAAAMQYLLRRQEQHDVMMRMMSDAQARHHETMMLIIRNIGPSGRFEYNGATGRYDRWVPYR